MRDAITRDETKLTGGSCARPPPHRQVVKSSYPFA
jgi:hypothetical protein